MSEIEFDKVLLIHGLCGSRLDMWPIAQRLRKQGRDVTNWGYRSLGNSIETHARRLAEWMDGFDQQNRNRKVHIVAHSMGGIIVRAMLEERVPENLGRVLMLASPHKGSHVARKLTPFLGWATSSLEQLSDVSDSFVNRLGNSFEERSVEFAIIEASKDRVIAPGKAIIDGYRDYAQVAGHHGVLPWYPSVIRMVESYLDCGRLLRDQPAPSVS